MKRICKPHLPRENYPVLSIDHHIERCFLRKSFQPDWRVLCDGELVLVDITREIPKYDILQGKAICPICGQRYEVY